VTLHHRDEVIPLVGVIDSIRTIGKQIPPVLDGSTSSRLAGRNAAQTLRGLGAELQTLAADLDKALKEAKPSPPARAGSD
jgi:hypothetical protein